MGIIKGRDLEEMIRMSREEKWERCRQSDKREETIDKVKEKMSLTKNEEQAIRQLMRKYQEEGRKFGKEQADLIKGYLKEFKSLEKFKGEER